MPLTFAFFTCAMLLVVPARKKTAASTITIIKVVNFRIVFPLFVYGLISLRTLLQLGDLGVLRGVFHGFSEEAKTLGFPSPSFGGFGFVLVTVLSVVEDWRDCLLVNLI